MGVYVYIYMTSLIPAAIFTAAKADTVVSNVRQEHQGEVKAATTCSC